MNIWTKLLPFSTSWQEYAVRNTAPSHTAHPSRKPPESTHRELWCYLEFAGLFGPGTSSKEACWPSNRLGYADCSSVTLRRSLQVNSGSGQQPSRRHSRSPNQLRFDLYGWSQGRKPFETGNQSSREIVRLIVFAAGICTDPSISASFW